MYVQTVEAVKLSTPASSSRHAREMQRTTAMKSGKDGRALEVKTPSKSDSFLSKKKKMTMKKARLDE